MASSLSIPRNSTVFRSKKGPFFGLIIWGIIGGCFYMNASPFLNNQWSSEKWMALLISTMVWVPILYLLGSVWFNTRYTIKDDQLYLQMGIFSYGSIEVAHIGLIERSYSLQSSIHAMGGTNSPALAVKGLRIHFWGGHVKVSPKNETAFINALKEINPTLKVAL